MFRIPTCQWLTAVKALPKLPNVYGSEHFEAYMVRRIMELDRSCVIVTRDQDRRYETVKEMYRLDALKPTRLMDKCLLITNGIRKLSWRNVLKHTHVEVITLSKLFRYDDQEFLSDRYKTVIIDAYDEDLEHVDDELYSDCVNKFIRFVEYAWLERLFVFKDQVTSIEACAEIFKHEYGTLDFIERPVFADELNVYHVRHDYTPFERFMMASILHGLQKHYFEAPIVEEKIQNAVLTPVHAYQKRENVLIERADDYYDDESTTTWTEAFEEVKTKHSSVAHSIKGLYVDYDGAFVPSSDTYVSSRLKTAEEVYQHLKSMKETATLTMVVQTEETVQDVQTAAARLNLADVAVKTLENFDKDFQTDSCTDGVFFLQHRGKEFTDSKAFKKLVQQNRIIVYLFSGNSEYDQQYENEKHNATDRCTSVVFEDVWLDN